MRIWLFLKSVMLIIVILFKMLLLTVPASAQSKAFTVTALVKRGDPRPDGGTFFSCDTCVAAIPDFRAFNRRGEVLVETINNFFGNFDALFLLSESSKTIVFDAAHPTPWGTLNLSSAALNNVGQVGLVAYNPGAVKTYIFFYTNGELVHILDDQEPPPGGGPFIRASIFGARINDVGEMVIEGFYRDAQEKLGASLYLYSNGRLGTLVTSGEAAPIGGFMQFFGGDCLSQINAKGEVLFHSAVYNQQLLDSKDGIFMVTPDGLKKVVDSRDQLPVGNELSYPFGMLNDKSDVAFTANTLANGTMDKGGVYLYSNGQIHQIARVGDQTPIGGRFALLLKGDYSQPQAKITNNSTVIFKAAVKNGSASKAIFLASPQAIVKVVAVGDRVEGGRIADIDTYATNDLGEVAFVALDKRRRPLGIFKAAPVMPGIQSVRLRRKHGAPELLVDGVALITNDSVIEINGVGLGALDYPTDYREDGGTTTRIVSRDLRLGELLQPGQTVQVTIYNALTNQHSKGVSFTP